MKLTEDPVLRLRMRAQRLAGLATGDAADLASVVKEVCGVQAQEMPAAGLAVRARSSGLVAADVDRARVEERSVVRTWGPRGTLHLLAVEDLGWMLPLLGPVFVGAGARRRAQLGLDDNTYARALRVARDVLAGKGPLTRGEIVDELAARGIRLEGQARPHFLGRAALEGVICMGPDKGADPTYVLLSDWVEPGTQLPEEAARRELAWRYVQAYGPATPEDLAAWSGLPMSKVREAWRGVVGQLLEVEVEGKPAWMPRERAGWLERPAPDGPVLRLLARYDSYLLGYQNRDLVVPPAYAKCVNAGGGIVHPVVLVDGRAVGTWRMERRKNRVEVVVEPFEGLRPDVLPGVGAEVEDIGRFLGVDARVVV